MYAALYIKPCLSLFHAACQKECSSVHTGVLHKSDSCTCNYNNRIIFLNTKHQNISHFVSHEHQIIYLYICVAAPSKAFLQQPGACLEQQPPPSPLELRRSKRHLTLQLHGCRSCSINKHAKTTPSGPLKDPPPPPILFPEPLHHLRH